MAALFYDPTTNALTVPSRPALTTSTLMAQDPARYDIYGGSLDLGMTNTSALPANDPDAKYADLVRRFLQEGNSYEKSKQMALDMVDPIVTSESVQHESGDPEAAMQAAMQAQATANPDRRFRDMSQGAQDARGALASVNTGTSGEPPVLATGPRLTPLGEALVEAKNGLRTKIDNIIDNGLSVTYQGNEVFAIDGNGTATPITAEDAKIIESQTGSTAQDPTAITGPFMGGYGQDSLPPVPALASPNESGTGNTDSTSPALAQPTVTSSNTASNGNAARRMTGGYTGNARGSALPDMQIGLNERLMRMGAAGLAAGGQGSLAQMGAMFGASADVNQANRQAEMEAFGIEEERRQAHAARVAALAASKNKGAGGGDIGSVGDVRMGMAKLQTALDMFDADTDSSISGYNWQAIYSRLYGRTLGNEDEAKRLFLNELRLDSIMQRVAETKGAISNAEMQLFASQAPTMDSNDIVWTSWLKRQLQMQQIILNRLQTGQRVDESAPITTTMPNLDRGGGGSTGGGADFTEADKLVGI